MQKFKHLKSVQIGSLHYAVGQRVSQQFPRTVDSRFFTPVITGTLQKIIETQNAAFATIREDNGALRLVVLG